MMTVTAESRKKSKIMGVINVTPDSFSDGGKYSSLEHALAKLQNLIDDGADIIDIGAESSRPGASPISEDEEWQRLLPLLQEIKAQFPSLRTPLSLDTYKPGIMRKALAYDISYINNIFGLCDSATLKTLATHSNIHYIAMHLHGKPENMQEAPMLGSLTARALDDFAVKTTEALEKAGFTSHRIYLDPGIGFGKTDSANLIALDWSLAQAKNHQLMLGISRKGFLSRIYDPALSPPDRDSISKALETSFILNRVSIIRTHEVKTLKTVLQLLNGECEYA